MSQCTEIQPGAVVNYLTVIGASERMRGSSRLWECRCVCGKTMYAVKWFLQHGRVKSCGCKTQEILSELRKRHGETDTPTWKSWKSMHDRCHLPSHKSFPSYGGRGIFVCERWHTYENFREDMGVRPEGLTLGRICNDLGYEPGNCRWETPKQQARNRSSSNLITHNGKTLCLSAWAEETGLPITTIAKRLKKGWDPISAVTKPRRNQPLHHRKKQAA